MKNQRERFKQALWKAITDRAGESLDGLVTVRWDALAAELSHQFGDSVTPALVKTTAIHLKDETRLKARSFGSHHGIFIV